MSEHAEPKTKTVKVPGPDHPITIERNAHRVVVKVAGRVVADTREALTLREASYPPVQYIPRKDVDMTLLARTDHANQSATAPSGAIGPIPAGRERPRLWRLSAVDLAEKAGACWLRRCSFCGSCSGWR